jgi:hypothetical protein
MDDANLLSAMVYKPKDLPESPGTPALVPASPYDNSPSSGLSSAPRTPESAPRSPLKFDLGGSHKKAPTRKPSRYLKTVAGSDGEM